MEELPIIQKTYDLIKWYIPILTRLPRIHKFTLGDRMTNQLYDLLEGLLTARDRQEKLSVLEPLKSIIDILKYQTRILFAGLTQNYGKTNHVREASPLGRRTRRTRWR
ncbi:diversity-generating retroelement protein Avd [Nodularia spumigena CS-591/12]|uniref:diversity-generating retroelement protein Avd n=1 Tax=Nodularia spumigena TaxID=70799 RepID=UPI0023301646|nr:diversity-generating retroelement protein Avd [Nodularia spumigena]MDB9303494.1 diversity-generating retroelement protein Avd [Nodularia spumigena CS-591/12]